MILPFFEEIVLPLEFYRRDLIQMIMIGLKELALVNNRFYREPELSVSLDATASPGDPSNKASPGPATK
jgi:hypothetical protein